MIEIINILLESTDSTNNYAKKHYNQFDPNKLTCIIAQEQTAGRGRLQRHWHSPSGQNIYATFCFQLPLHTRHLISLAHIITLSAAQLLMNEGLQPQIKWPNDILIHDKKIAGVLCETEFHSDHVDVFLGIGINVNMGRDQLKFIDQKATSLFLENNHSWDVSLLIKKLQKQFLIDLQQFKKEGFTPFHAKFENLLAYKGHSIRCFDGKKEWIGICHSITSDGQLNIYLPNKEMHTLSAGDIEFH